MQTKYGGSIWKFRFKTYLKMLEQFSFFSNIKLAVWFFKRKVLKCSDKSILGKVYVKRLKKEVLVRKYNVSDFGLLIDFFVSDVHEEGGHYNFQQINPCDNIKYVLDGGGNIGFFSLLYAEKYPEANIITVEPEESNFRVLRKNCRLYNNIIPIKAGLWNKNTELVIENPESHSTGFVVRESKVEDDSDGQVINAVSIPSIMKKYHIAGFDIIKLDVEGSEFPIFMDDRCEGWLKKTRFVIMEIHDTHMSGGREMICSRMKSCRFEHTIFAGDDLFENKECLNEKNL